MKEFTGDLTVIYLTAEQHPENWLEYQQETLFAAIAGFPLIVVTRDPKAYYSRLRKTLPMNRKEDIPFINDTEPKSHLNMYKQMLAAAKLAKTPYIASAEDDVLYSRDHFTYFRPPLDTFSYNHSRWSLYTWNPVFSIKNRKSNCTLVAPRELFIEAWEERLAKFDGNIPDHRVGEVGRPNLDQWLGVTVRKCVEYWSGVPVIHLNHDNGTDSVGQNKKLGEYRALEIPVWGRAEDIVRIYNG